MNPNIYTPYLSGIQLKDKARNALSGRIGQFALVVFIMFAIKLATELFVELIAILLYSMYIVINELLIKGLTMDEFYLLLEDMASMQPYLDTFQFIDYIVVQITSVFNNVFSVGTALFALNIACNNPTRVSDLFYGFRHQFGKALKLSALFVLINQFSALPSTIMSFLLDRNAPTPLIYLVLGVSLVGISIYLPLYYSMSQAYFLMLDFPDYSVGKLIKLSSNLIKGHKFRLFALELSFLPLLLLSLLTFGIGIFWLVPYMQVTKAFFFLNLIQARNSSQTYTPNTTASAQTY